MQQCYLVMHDTEDDTVIDCVFLDEEKATQYIHTKRQETGDIAWFGETRDLYQ